jgi:hypothetical protein
MPQTLLVNSARPADNHTIIIEFRVEDVDSEYKRLNPLVTEWVQEPTTMPWGNRSIRGLAGEAGTLVILAWVRPRETGAAAGTGQ